MKKLKETVARLEKSGGLPKAPESGQLHTLRQERDKLQKEKDNLTTDLKKVCHNFTMDLKKVCIVNLINYFFIMYSSIHEN